MLDKEIAEIVKSHSAYLSFLQWGVGVGISAVIAMIGTTAGMLFKFFRDFRGDAVRRMREHELKINQTITELRHKVETGEKEMRENSENLIRHEGDIRGIIQVCKERHGK